MRIGVNGRFLAARPTGVQRFAHEVVRRLCDVTDVTLFLPAGIAAPDWRARVVVGRKTGLRWEQRELPRVSAACDVLLQPANAGAVATTPYVCVVHDVLPLTDARWFSPAFAAWYRLMLPRLARGAARIVTPSEWSRRELCRELDVAPGRVRVTPQGLEPFAAPATAAAVSQVRTRYQLPEQYLLFVGAGDPRKRLNFMYQVLDAWRATGDTPPPLVVVGDSTRRVHGALAAARSAHDVRMVGHCDDETLLALYTGAAALCFPSSAEGFGRPPLEAIACGTPVVATAYATAAETIAGLASIEPLDAVRWAWRLRAIVAAGARVHHDVSRWSWDSAVAVVADACAEAVTRRRSSRAAIAPTTTPQRVALVHDWLTGMRGGERVLEALLELYPQADVFTLLHVPHSASHVIESRLIHASYIDRAPFAHSHYRYYLPFFPRAIESLDLTGYELVISSSHCVAKGVITRGIPHLSYCHTPMRYAWDRQLDYGSALTRRLARPVLERLRAWDRATAGRPDRIIANSAHVQQRIRSYWGRDARVVHPPVDVNAFKAASQKDDYYIVAGALVPYKRVDLAIHAFRQLGRRLMIVGDGPEYRHLQRVSAGHAEFTGRVSDAELRELVARARALVMPMVEDFGIIAVEAQAAGTPVIALGRGGALESVVDIRSAGVEHGTGLFFDEQTPASLAAAVCAADAYSFLPAALHRNAQRFTPQRFQRQIRSTVQEMLDEKALTPKPEYASTPA